MSLTSADVADRAEAVAAVAFAAARARRADFAGGRVVVVACGANIAAATLAAALAIAR